jgi:hypothetical protein
LFVCVSIFYSMCIAMQAMQENFGGSYQWQLSCSRQIPTTKPTASMLLHCTLHDPLDWSQKSPSIARCSRDSRILLVIGTGRIALEQATVRISTIMVERPSLNYRTPYEVVRPETPPLGKRHRCRSRAEGPMERERSHDAS